MVKTIEQLKTEEATAREALNKAQARFTRAHNALTKALKAEEAKTAMTLELALEAEVSSGWNERGSQFLNELTWKGEWKGTGLMAGGGYWPKTGQNVLKLAVNHKWDDAKLAELETIILKVMPLIRPGAFEGNLKLMTKGSSVDASTLRVLDIFEHNLSEFSNWTLGQMENGEWVVFDARILNRSWGRARLVGSLTECLSEVRNYLWYEGGEREEDSDGW